MDDVEVLVDEKEFAKAGTLQQKRVRRLVKELKTDPFLGDMIQRERIPKRFRRYGNLFRSELPEGWRALHTVQTLPSQRREVRVVFIGNHTRYDRLFGYKSS